MALEKIIDRYISDSRLQGLENYFKKLINFAYKLYLVRFNWLVALTFKNAFSKKIKVGIGPVVTGEKTLHTRKWWIDPIVDGINSTRSKYIANIYVGGNNLSQFDIVIIVKNFDFLTNETLEELKKQGVIIIYAIVDNPAGCQKNYETDGRFTSLLDGFITCNPIQEKEIQHFNVPTCYTDSPIINTAYKRIYPESDAVTIIWEGMSQHLQFMVAVEEIILQIAARSGKKIQLIYFTNKKDSNSGIVKYVEWQLAKREQILCSADIAITVKSTNDKTEARKPSTKICTYMAAGLPVICAPSDADKQIIEHGRTGYFANSDEEWREYLELLIENSQLRKDIGAAGRKHVTHEQSIEKVTLKYVQFFDTVMKNATTD